ncbi:hypothetical protein AAG747_28985 [Rapidithrix thailandica]|uniref:SMI1/KNR4 family protein n=1 Tax=Rapidithrix thailandica TaxID=413964 RepID=A0AAW9SH82_9BACT
MNFQYTIHSGDKPIIKIRESELKSLEDLLNTLCIYPHIESVIDEFKVIYENSSDLNDLIEDKYNGYWEDDLLGKSFTVLGYDNGLDVFVNENMIYIEDEYQYPEIPRVKLSMSEFIQTLEDWRDILKSYSKS